MCDFGISRQPRGAALVIVMLVMAVLLMAGTAFLTISSTESQIALNEQGSVGAHVLAEAGIHKALAFYYANPSSPYATESNTALGGGTFTVSVTKVTGCDGTATSARQIAAIGSVPIRGGTAQAQLQVTLDRVSYPYGWGVFAAVPNGIVASSWWCGSCGTIFGANRQAKELWLADNNSVDSFDSGAGSYDAATNSGQSGNVGGNSDVAIDYNSTIPGYNIKGNVQAGGAFYPGTGVQVSGTVTTGGQSFPFPSVSAPWSMTDLTVTRGTQTLSPGTYVYRNMTFSDGASLVTSGSVKIYVTGTVSIGNNVSLGSYPGTQLQIVTYSNGNLQDPGDTSSFQAGNGFTLYGSLYGRNTDVKLGTDAQIFGSIIGRTVYVQSRGKIHLDRAMSNQAVCNPGGNFTILRGTWREIIPST